MKWFIEEAKQNNIQATGCRKLENQKIRNILLFCNFMRVRVATISLSDLKM